MAALDLDLSLDVVVGGNETGQRETADTLAPLPTLSAYYRHAFNDKLALRLSGAWLSATVDNWDGDVVAADVSLEYWPSSSWGFGAGYNYVDIDVTAEENIFDQKYVVEYDSFFAFVSWSF